MTRDPVRQLVLRLTGVAMVILLALSLAASWAAMNSFDRVLLVELRLKAATVGEMLQRQIERALDYDIPLDQLPGLSVELAEETALHPDIAFAAVVDGRGGALASAGERLASVVEDNDVVIPLRRHGETVAQLRLGVDPAYGKKASLELILEIGSEMLSSALITFEILLLFVHLASAKVNLARQSVVRAEGGDFRGAFPVAVGRFGAFAERARSELARVNRRASSLGADARAELAARFRLPVVGEPLLQARLDLVYLRLPVFLLCMSEELTRPFLTAFAQSLAPTAPWISPQLAVGLPITLFMLTWALSQPLGARLSGWMGRREAFAMASLLAAAGLVLTATTAHLLAFLVWRCLTAVGFGVGLIAAQGLIVDNTGAEDRASGLAMYIGPLLAAGVCGPLVGGIVTEQVGPRANFLIGAVAVLLAGAMVHRLFRMAAKAPKTTQAPELLSGSARALVGDRRFAALLILAAIPAKIAAAGVLFYLVPLVMAEAGATAPEIGRTQMAYYLCYIVCAPLAAKLSDRWAAWRDFIAVGGLATLVSCAPMLAFGADWAAPLAIGLFGAAQALVGAPQLTLVTRDGVRLGVPGLVAIGWYRLLERLGGAAGPLLLIAFASVWSYREAWLAIGILCAVCSTAFWLIYRAGPSGTAKTLEARS